MNFGDILSIIFRIGVIIFSLYVAGYVVIGLFFTKKFKPSQNFHKYAILIAARNEQAVIGNLLDSISRQDYPSEYLTVFVVADNCTDNTAEIARSKGAVCYERFDDSRRTKGFALQFLFENIKKDYGIDSFEGYFVFDADNLLNVDYISRMNDAFDSGEKIITSYRNTKNFDENWVASTYALHWLRSIRFGHRARSVLGLATNIQGTGFLFANELVPDGWKFTSLTEDRAFTADAVVRGYSITYNDAAEFFDEQPTKIKVALRQRLRWSKGHMLAFAETGWSLFKSIFVGKSYKTRNNDSDISSKEAFLLNLRCKIASLDTLAMLVPVPLFSVTFWLLTTVFVRIFAGYTQGLDSQAVFIGNNFLSKILELIFGTAFEITLSPGISAAIVALLIVIFHNAINKISFHIKSMLVAVYVFIVERKRMIKMPFYKKILYTITWPVFDAIGRWTVYFAFFMKIEWKPIPHTSTVTINQIEKAKVELKKD